MTVWNSAFLSTEERPQYVLCIVSRKLSKTKKMVGRAPAPPRQQAAAPTEQSLLAAAPEQRLPSTSTRLSSPS
jgi:hypothetical protein